MPVERQFLIDVIDLEGHVVCANRLCLRVSVRHRRALSSDIRDGSIFRENREDQLPKSSIEHRSAAPFDVTEHPRARYIML